jgi:hypothetical protein
LDINTSFSKQSLCKVWVFSDLVHGRLFFFKWPVQKKVLASLHRAN